MASFTYQDSEPRRSAGSIAVDVPVGITRKLDLLSWFSDSLSFPDYFGMNWDGLSDCLRDLAWLPEHSVYVVHTDVPALGLRDRQIYLEVLNEAVDAWAQHDGHELVVIFPKRKKKEIDEMLEQ